MADRIPSDGPHHLPNVPMVVPDASVGAKWYLDDEEDTEVARGMFGEYEEGQITLVAPDCFFYELGALVRRAERRTPPRLTATQTDAICQRIVALHFERYPSQDLLADAVSRARMLDISLYDALYLVLAEALGATFVTADSKLLARIGHLALVEWLGDRKRA